MLKGLLLLAIGMVLAQPSYQPIAENATFRLYLDEESLAFQLRDNRSGHLWRSGLDEVAEGDRLNRPWQAFARSGVSISYLEASGASRRLSLTNAATTIAVQQQPDGAIAQLSFDEVGIGFTLQLTLTPEGVRVEVPLESIREDDPRFRLSRLELYPFLGATRGDSVPGYIFFPDGVGSIVPLGETPASTLFSARYCGADWGISAVAPDPQRTLPHPLSAPVFGIVHQEQHALLAIIDSGTPYAELQLHPAGAITNFNFAHLSFIYAESYLQPINRAGDRVTAVQRQRNPVEVAVEYRFLTGEQASYLGMAHSYRSYLIARGLLPAQPMSGDIGLRLSVVAAEQTPQLWWRRTIPITTAQQLAAMLEALELPNVQLIYHGWQPGGLSSPPPRRLALARPLGSLAELGTLAARLAEQGGRLWLALLPHAAPPNASRRELATTISGTVLEGKHRYLRLAAVSGRYQALAADIARQLPQAGVALSDLNTALYSEFEAGELRTSRALAADSYRQLLLATPVAVSLNQPNPCLAIGELFWELALDHSGYRFARRAVPFWPAVLAGRLPYYGPPLNLAADLREALLKHAEYGAYPSFWLSYDAARLLNTPSRQFYGTAYPRWQTRIQESYRWLNRLLGPLAGAEMIAREQLADGIIAVHYTGDRTIVVNYTGTPYQLEELVVPARDAVLWEER